MECIKGSIYDWPKYYDFVYGSDWKAETDFLGEAFRRYVEGPTRRVFEPACGTGRLLFRMAKLGYEVSGIDLNQAAVDFCNQRMARHGFPKAARLADMTDFALPRPVDAAFNTINSFRHLASDRRAIGHLKSMVHAIRPGGVYVLGLHLSPTAGEADDNESWSHRRGHLQVNASMWLEKRNMCERIETYNMVFDVLKPTKQFRIQDRIEFRTYKYDEFERLLAKVPELRTEAVFDFAYDVSRPIAVDAASQDVLYVLRRV